MNEVNLEKFSKDIDLKYIPKNIEKNKFAEVSTPFVLRKDMLDILPKSFWKNKKNKVFEPSSGKGGFLIDIVRYFMEGLKDKIKNKKLRYKHIVEKQLYFGDINKNNIELGKKLIDPLNKYKLNTYIGDTLNLDIKKEWDIDGFNAVIANPPYNISQEAKDKKGGGDSLWDKFVIKGLDDWLVKDGYLLYVHPSGWRKPLSEKAKFKDLFKIMTSDNYMIYLEIHDTRDGMKIFNCGTRYDWYLIKKVKNKNKKTMIKDEKGFVTKINLNEWDFLPNYNFNNVKKILAKKNDETVDILFSRSAYDSRKKDVSEKKTSKFKYPLVHTTPKSGVRYMYTSNNKRGYFGTPKVIFGETGIYNVVIDKNGKYGMTQESMAIKDKISNFSKIKKALESNKFKEILNACSWSNFRIDWRLFTYMKKDFWKDFI